MNLDPATLITTTTDVAAPLRPAAEPTAVEPAKPASPRETSVAKTNRPRPAWRVVGAAAPALATEVGSRFLYVAEQGAMLRKEGSRIRVAKKGVDLLQVSSLKLETVAVYGNVQISTQCLRALLDEGVSLVLFSRNGTYRGRLVGPADAGAALRRRQWERSCDAAFCLGFAKGVVRGKLLGAMGVAAAYAKNYLAETLGTAHTILKKTLAGLDDVEDIERLRGSEGAAARAWFDLFGRCNRSSLPFDGREKRPSTDPLNALLSFGYMMLLRELEGLLHGAGLDPCVGFYHGAHGNRPALACDFVEEFRHAVVDRLVLGLVNRGSIKAEHFQDLGERGLRLTPDGLRQFVTAYERMLLGEGGVAGGYRAIFLQQLGRLLDAIAGRAPYVAHLETEPAPASDVMSAKRSELANGPEREADPPPAVTVAPDRDAGTDANRSSDDVLVPA